MQLLLAPQLSNGNYPPDQGNDLADCVVSKLSAETSTSKTSDSLIQDENIGVIECGVVVSVPILFTIAITLTRNRAMMWQAVSVRILVAPTVSHVSIVLKNMRKWSWPYYL